jgi:hypothetical protein
VPSLSDRWYRYAPLVRFTPRALYLLHAGYAAGRVGYVEVSARIFFALYSP